MPDRTRDMRQRLRDRRAEVMASGATGVPEAGDVMISAPGRSSVDALSVGEVFEIAVRDVLAMGGAVRRVGGVDIGVTFNAVKMHRSGMLGAVFGGEDRDASIRVQLATRVNLDDVGTDGDPDGTR